MKANLVYFTTTGHTETMANAVKEALEVKGYEVNMYNEAQEADFADADLLVFGSPACGTEEVDETIIMPTIEAIGSFEGKKIFMFGSFGWGDGEYMETWKEEMKSKGAELAAEPVVCLEDPDDDVIAKLKAAVESI